MKMKYISFWIFFVFAQIASAESPSVTISAACAQGVLSDNQCPQPARQCVHESESSTESVVEMNLGGRTLSETVFGNESGRRRLANGTTVQVDSCDEIGRIRAADVNQYVDKCDFVPTNKRYSDASDINSLAQLQLRDSLINAMFQDLASRSVSQINCRLEVFDNYIKDKNSSRSRLNTKAETKFKQVLERIQGLILTKQISINKIAETHIQVPAACVGMGCGPVSREINTISDNYEKAIAAEISKIPFGYEPDVATALFEMAQNGQFNEAAYLAALEKAQNKYSSLKGYYTDNDTPQNGGTRYCISKSYKEFAVSTGVVQKLLNSYPESTLNPQAQEILQCKLNSKYKTAPENIDSTLNAAFLVGGGIAAVVTAVPTAGGSLATYGTIAGIGLSAASFAQQVQRAHESCRQRSFLTSPTGQELCQADLDFDHEVNQTNLSSCLAQTGLAALEAVPIAADVAALLRGRTTASRTVDLLEEYNAPPIVVTAERRSSSGGTRSAVTETRASTRRTPTRTNETAVSTKLSTTPPLTEQQISAASWNYINQGLEARQVLRRTPPRPNTDLERIIESASDASESIKETLRASARIMNNLDSKWNDYIPDLIEEVGQSMLRSTIPSVRARALSGEITRNDVLRVLVARARARGETFKTVKNSDTDNFFETVQSGPFFDRFFKNSKSDHGVDVHLLQRDFLAQQLPAEQRAKMQEMFEYLGTSEGRNIWNEMFDSDFASSLTCPEELMRMIKQVLPLR